MERFLGLCSSVIPAYQLLFCSSVQLDKNKLINKFHAEMHDLVTLTIETFFVQILKKVRLL